MTGRRRAAARTVREEEPMRQRNGALPMTTILTVLVVLLSTAPAAAGGIDPDLLAGMKARAIGPAGMSGRIASIAAVEADPATVYAGAATGGVWKSANGGLTWTPVFDDQPVAAVGAVAVFQPNPDIVWVGTGEGNPRNSASVGNGVYKSVDGGRTWRHLGLDGTERIHRIVLHPTDPDVAYAAAMGREWGENPERGVYKTVDGGKTWTRVLFVDERTGAADLVMDPVHPDKLFAAMWQFRRWPYYFRSGGPGSGLFVTHDGGASWRRLQPEDGFPKGELGRIGVAVCRSRPEVVYALVEADKSALVRSDDGGRSWRTVNAEPNVAPRPFYYADIAVDPAWPQRVYSLDYTVRVSDDGGKSFETLPGARFENIHGDYHALWINPRDPEHLYVGNDGGVAESRDRGRTMRFVGNLPLGQYYHIAVDTAVPYHVLGGMQDNGSWRGPAWIMEEGGIRNHHWRMLGFGDGFDVQADPADPAIGYSMWQGGNLGRWDVRTGEWRHVRPPEPPDGKLRFNWNAALAIDPFDPATIYYGSQFVHVSPDRGETWRAISPDLTTNRPEWQLQDSSGGLTSDVTAAENYCTLIAIAPSPAARGVIWAGSDDGRIHVTRDGGATWTSVEGNLPGAPANAWVPHIEASPFDPAEAFVVLDDHRRSNWTPYVYKTVDFGKTWTSLVTPALRGWALVVEQDPVDRDLLFLGTEFGLYVSVDGGRAWLPWRHGVPTVSVMDLVVHPTEHDLVVGTHSRSALVLDDIRPLRELSAETMAKPLHLFAAADARQFWRDSQAGGFGLGDGEFRGENRPYGAIFTYSLNRPDLPLPEAEKEKARQAAARAEKAKGSAWEPAPVAAKTDARTEEQSDEPPQVAIRITDAAGQTVRTFKGPAALGLNRAVWDLRRDGFREPARRGGRRRSSEPAPGPELPPGVYSATVTFQGQTAATSFQVLPDPRSTNTPADWARRWAAIERIGRLQETAAAAVDQIADARTDVEAVVERVRGAELRRLKEAREEPDEDKLAGLPLVKSGRALVLRLDELERRLHQPPGTVGIVGGVRVMERIGKAMGAVTSAWAPPSPTHEAYILEAEGLLASALTALNELMAGEVAEFRQAVSDAGVGLLPAPAPLAMPAPEGR
jgi:photosystem II stability/assembly factor-like uncharacterized protein